MNSDLTKIRVLLCPRCRNKKANNRHHKGNEKMFAKFRPDLYLRRYKKFLEADIVRLCEDCHFILHYETEYSSISFAARRTMTRYKKRTNKGPPKRVCEKYRLMLVWFTEDWIKFYAK